MGYWQEVREVVLRGFDIALDGIKEGAAKAVELGKDGVVYTQLKTNLFFEHRKLQLALADLGDHTRDLLKEKKDIHTDKTVSDIMSNIAIIEDECKRIQGEIQSLGFELKKS